MPKGGELDWKLYTEFCALHEAETSVIPLGERDGFPTEINFAILPERLLRRWIGEKLDAIAKNPSLSSLFNETVGEIARMGKTRWSAMGNQAASKVLNRTMPG